MLYFLSNLGDLCPMYEVLKAFRGLCSENEVSQSLGSLCLGYHVSAVWGYVPGCEVSKQFGNRGSVGEGSKLLAWQYPRL